MILISTTVIVVTISIPTASSAANFANQRQGNRVIAEKFTQANPNQMYSISSVDGMEWVNTSTGSSPGVPPQFEVIDSNMTGMTVIADIGGFWRGNMTLNGTFYDTIQIPNAGTTNDIGNPTVPCLINHLEIPFDVDITIAITQVSLQIMDGYNITPFQVPSIGISNITRVGFTYNHTTYSTDAFYPNYNVTTSGEASLSPIIMRGRRLLVLSLYPIHFNSVTHQLLAYSHVEVRISYSHAAVIEQVDAALYSNTFEILFQNLILNYIKWNASSTTNLTAKSSNFIRSDTSSECDPGLEHYLIIAYDDFADAAHRLADWKTRKGIPCIVNTTSQIFGDTSKVDEAIDVDQYGDPDPSVLFDKISKMKQFLQKVYTEWHPVPTYVLFIGDSTHIPCDYSIPHTATYHDPKNGDVPVHGFDEVSKIATDVTYFCTEGVGYYADIIHGRISVANRDEANAIISKIIDYETNPPDVRSFYSDVMISSYFQDKYDDGTNDEGSDGTEDEPFIQTSEELADYLTSRQYVVYKEYTRYGTVNPSKLYDGVTDVDHSLVWNADTSSISANINEGRFLVYHIDHGTSQNFFRYFSSDPLCVCYGQFDGWDHPRYTTQEVTNPLNENYLSNGNFLPLVLSMDCDTGWFDGETDGFIDSIRLDNLNAISFAEAVTRKNPGGAIAVVAPTRTSFNIAAAKLADGITRAIWPESPETKPIFNIGAALKLGKQYVQTQYDLDSGYSMNEMDITLLIYHLFGDPEMPLWTESPTTLIVENREPICPGTQTYDVQVTDVDGIVENAVVCLQKGDEIYEVKCTDQTGLASFTINPLTEGSMNVTVTKHNAKPYLAEIPVVECICWICILGVGILLFVFIIPVIIRIKIIHRE